ncbi:MAG: cnrB [Firmicutes bacterium]|nr:cnrB [Bacillota bacterium]
MGNFIKKHRRPIVLTTIIIIALTLVASCNRTLFTRWTNHFVSRSPINVSAVAIGTINKPSRIVRTGLSGNSNTVPVNTEYSGSISQIYITEGQQVKAGQPLFKIEAASVPSSAGEPSTGAIVNQITGTSPQAQANYDSALKEVTRYQKLYDIGGISRRQLEESNARLQQAQEALNNTQNSVAVAATNTVGSASQLTGSVTITAPIDGIVMGLAVAQGKSVQAGEALMALGSGQEVEVAVQLDQNDLYSVQLGTPVAIEISGQTIMGQVSSINPEIQTNQISSFQAHIKLTNCPAGLITPGMSVNIYIDTGKSIAVLAVPNDAIFQDGQGKKFVYAAVNGAAVRQQINTGETIGDFTEIIASVSQEVKVITSNLDQIHDGDPILVIE